MIETKLIQNTIKHEIKLKRHIINYENIINDTNNIFKKRNIIFKLRNKKDMINENTINYTT